MVKCISVLNLLNQNELKCSLDTDSKDQFLSYIVKNQQKYMVYIWSFDDDTFYYAVNDDPIVIEQLDNKQVLEFLKYALTIKTKSERVISIMDNIKKLINSESEIKTADYSDAELKSKLDQLPSLYDPTVQQGGIIIKKLEEALPAISPILEIIDWILIIASTVIAAPPLSLVVDAVATVWALLRWDLPMFFGSIVSFVPGIGDIIGGGIRVLAKIFKYIGRLFRKSR